MTEKKYLGKADKKLDSMFSELDSIDRTTKTGRKKYNALANKIRRARTDRVLSGLKGLFASRNYPVPAGATGAGSTMGFVMPPESFDKKTTKPSIEEIIPQGRIKRFAEPNIELEKLPTRTLPDLSNILGPNQLKSFQRRIMRMQDNPDAYERNTDYAMERLPNYLQNQYRNELMSYMQNYQPQNFQAGGQLNLAQQAQNVAAQGRFGDSMLMHVNPAEVRGLAQAVPLTINPETGQPEAFLPFLAPLIGSFLGPSLFGAMGATGALTGLAGSALGSGLAQWAATGDFKKGLLAGVTGYGIGTALQGAAGAAQAGQAAKTATDVATSAGTAGATGTQEAIKALTTQAGQEGIKAAAAQTPFQNLAQVFNPGAAGTAGTISSGVAGASGDLLQAGAQVANPSFAQGLGNLASGFSQPVALAATPAGTAPTAIMESQEQFAADMAQREREEQESRMQNFLMNPEPILYSAQGGTTNFDEGGATEVDSTERFLRMLSPVYSMYKTGDYMGLADSGMLGMMPKLLGPEGVFRGEKEETEEDKGVLMDADLIAKSMASPSGQMMAQGGRVGYRRGGRPGLDSSGESFMASEFGGGDVNTYSGDFQRFTPARQTYEVNPNFMPGFQGETMYFNPNTINQPASATRPGTAPKPSVDVFRGGKGGYNTPGLAIAPQTSIDPYAPITSAPPQGLIQTEAVTYPGDVVTPPDTPPITPPVVPPVIPPIDIPPIDIPFNIPGMGNLDFGNLGQLDFSKLGLDFANNPVEGFEGIGDIDFTNIKALGQVPNPIAPVDQSINNPMSSQIGLGPEDLGISPNMSISPNLNLGIPTIDRSLMPTAPMQAPAMQDNIAMQSPQLDTLDTALTNPRGDFMSIENLNIPELGMVSGGFMPQPNTNLATTLPVNPVAPNPLVGIAPPMSIPQIDASLLPQDLSDPSMILGGRRALNPMMAGGGDTKKQLPNKGLEALNKEAPEVVEKMGFQEGGATDIMQDPITQEAIQFIMGESDNQQVVNDFIAKYGNEMFLQLRNTVLQSLVPGAQTEGLIAGEGRSGMADDIPGMIGADEKIAVSQDEFIVPADVVSALGDGSSDAGSNALYGMMDRVRQAKTGGTTQPPRIDLNKVMPG